MGNSFENTFVVGDSSPSDGTKVPTTNRFHSLWCAPLMGNSFINSRAIFQNRPPDFGKSGYNGILSSFFDGAPRNPFENNGMQ